MSKKRWRIGLLSWQWVYTSIVSSCREFGKNLSVMSAICVCVRVLMFVVVSGKTNCYIALCSTTHAHTHTRTHTCTHACTCTHTHTHAHTHTHTHKHRGLLTGKFQRGQVFSNDEDSSRVAWVEADKSRSNQSHPSLQQWADKEKFWQLSDTLAEIATAHGH